MTLSSAKPSATNALEAVPHLTVALVGNPNTGKSTLFNALAGMRQRVGNYPGVTVETKKGRVRHDSHTFDLIDLPGTYSLAPRSPDEMVAVDVILGHQPGESRPDVIISIVDAANLERNLYLTTQLLELGVPVVIALNMIDLAAGQGRPVDAERLAKQLGLRVVPIQANKKRGLEHLKGAVLAAAAEGPPSRRPTFPEAFENEVVRLGNWAAQQQKYAGSNGKPVEDFLLRRLLLDVGGYTERCLTDRLAPALPQELETARARLAGAGCAAPAVEARARYAWIREAARDCVQRSDQPPTTWTDRIDRVLTHKVWGTVVFLGLMFVVFQSIFTWATPLMDAIDAGKSWLGDTLKSLLPAGALTSLLTNGILEGVGGVLVFLPQIVILFGFIAILEDCGYMARAAFLMDRLMARCGLSGKSFIPLLSSFACAIPGVMAARVIDDRRDRLATILVAPLMSCSARLPVYTLLIAAFLTDGYPWWVPGLTLFGMYLIGIVLAPLVALLLKRTLLRGATPIFLMELPPYKLPSVGLVVHRMYDRGKAFIVRAGTIILATMIVVWALLYFPHTDAEGKAYDDRLAKLEEQKEQSNDPDAIEDEMRELQGEWKRQSILGRVGKAIEPAVRPLGWDWRIGTAALASFPAREVVVGTLGIIYNLGEVDPGDDEATASLGDKLRAATWEDGSPRAGRPVFSVPVALSLMVFFALCSQCASTLAIIKRETNSWRWPVFTFAYMTVLAYVGALVTFQLGNYFTGMG
jgi:ferrous iron transport protein B